MALKKDFWHPGFQGLQLMAVELRFPLSGMSLGCAGTAMLELPPLFIRSGIGGCVPLSSLFLLAIAEVFAVFTDDNRCFAAFIALLPD